MPEPGPTVMLVHGALTDASVWHRVIAHLRERGLRVLAPALPMRSLDGDAAHLRGVLTALGDRPVIVAGHSWGGSVISHPKALTPSVRALVFVAAFAQDAGETAGELNDRFPGSQLGASTTVVWQRPDGADLTLRPEHFARVYAARRRPRLGRGDGLGTTRDRPPRPG